MGTLSTTSAAKASSQEQELTICLVGMPNAGKTTLMNALTGSNLQTANYSGVTVDISQGKTKTEYGPPLLLVDLPGVNSFFAPSPEEALSCEVLLGKHPVVKPDAMILIVDATQLERHLKFASFAARQGKPLVLAVTMLDLLARTQQVLDIKRLSQAIGVPVIAIDGRTGQGVKELLDTLRQTLARPITSNTLMELPTEPQAAFQAIRAMLNKSGVYTTASGSFFGDNVTSRIDSFVLHRYWGFPIFFLILSLLFATIFWVAQPFMDLIDAGFQWTAQSLITNLPQHLVVRFFAEGIVQGVGAVAVFFPQIVILFLLMTLLEDSGYLARGAALVDRPLSAIGLHGRSFVPMLSGYACAIPAVLAARAIPSRPERLMTIWILPLMSCSARLPVYALLLAAIFTGARSAQAGLMLAAIYLASMLISAAIAGIIHRFTAGRRRSLSLLAMELPAYRRPQLIPILRITWLRSFSYLQKAGLPIVIISAILWLLSNFGLGSQQPVMDNTATPPPFVVQSNLEHSFAAQIGKTLEPALRPMGVDWRVGVGLISAFAAREVFVSTMAIVFQVPDDDEEAQQQRLLQQMQQAKFSNSNQLVFTTASSIGLIIYFFFALQCISTVAVVQRETNSWQIAITQVVFYMGLAYILAVAAVQSLRWCGIA
jgi:ferrous iron transport protein B